MLALAGTSGARAQDAQGAEALAAPAPTLSASRAPAASIPDAPSGAPSLVRVQLLAGATVPIDLELSARVVFFDRLFVGGSLGFGVYGSLFAAVARPFSAPAGQLVSPVANGAFVASVSAGVRPFGGSGFELVAGYTMLHASSSFAPATVSAALGNQLSLPPGVPDLLLDTTLHALHVELGWTILIAEHLLIRPALGWTQVLAATTTLSTHPAIAVPQVSARLASSADTIDSALTKYGMTPTFSLALGYQF
jgi:hypothetical protein